MNSHLPPRELLVETHEFPCTYTFKVIGTNNEEFIQNIVSAVRSALNFDFDPPFESKKTSSGRHISMTFEPTVENPDQILAVYSAIQQQDGVILLL